jgi:hypothetical protein
MSCPRFPFWVVLEKKHTLNPPEQTPCDDPKAPHAFTDTHKLTRFLSDRRGGRWDVNLIADNAGLVVAIAAAHEQGVSGICFDPEPDGTGGQLISLADLLSQS